MHPSSINTGLIKFCSYDINNIRNPDMRLNTLQPQLHSSASKKTLSIKKLPRPLIRQRAYTIDSESEQFPMMNSKQQLISESSIGAGHKKSSSKLNHVGSASKLSPIKQYQTKLHVSAERWLVYDYRINKYKRGWRPAEAGDFTGMLRLLILRIFIELQKSNPEMGKVNVRVNTLYLKQQISLAKQRKLSPSKKIGVIIQDAITRVLQDNMIINILDLLYGIMLTPYDDLLEYAIIFVGYLCYCDMFDVNPILDGYHFVEKVPEAKAYADYLAQYATQKLFPALELKSSCFYADSYYLQSSPNDICNLFLHTENCSLFKQISSTGEYKSKVKYQLGYNFWQNRVIVFKNKRPELPATINGHSYQFTANWKGKRNYASIVKNKNMDILVVLQECKFGMFELDVRCVENWVKDIRKPIAGDGEGKKARFLAPLLKIADSSEGGTKLKRVNTQAI